ncbi:hypothetical protein JYT44_03515 [Caldithrix abyssi]|nr:hypothetical protein [Caldithrix abyssi]
MLKYLLSSLFFAQPLLIASEAQEKYEIDHTISSIFLKEDRPVTVHLPKHYFDSPGSTYSVLYVMDGQNRTKDTRYIAAYLHERRAMPEIIIVSVPHTYNRQRDFYPFNEETGDINKGVKNFTDFLEKELIPYIDKNFKTKIHRMILGHSASGVFVINTLITNPDLFKARFAFSPALHHNKPLVPLLEKFLKSNPSLYSYFYLNIGLKEFEPILMEFKKLKQILTENAPIDLKYQLVEFPSEGHLTTPFIGVYSALKALYVQSRLSLAELKRLANSKTLINYFDNLSEDFGYEIMPIYQSLASNWRYFYFRVNDKKTASEILELAMHYHPELVHAGNKAFLDHWNKYEIWRPFVVQNLKPQENFINNFGYEYLRQDKLTEAIHVFELNVKLYPNSANSFDSLGEAYEVGDKYEKAQIMYKKAVSIASKNADHNPDHNFSAFKVNLERIENKMKNLKRKMVQTKVDETMNIKNDQTN